MKLNYFKRVIYSVLYLADSKFSAFQHGFDLAVNSNYHLYKCTFGDVLD